MEWSTAQVHWPAVFIEDICPHDCSLDEWAVNRITWPKVNNAIAPIVITSTFTYYMHYTGKGKGKYKGSPCSITDRRVPELIPVLGRQVT